MNGRMRGGYGARWSVEMIVLLLLARKFAEEEGGHGPESQSLERWKDDLWFIYIPIFHR